jgi:hypothetical protein
MTRRAGAARSARRTLITAAALALLATGTATGGQPAESITAAQLHSLAAQASAGDSQALADLRAVTSVDGRPAQVGAALGTGDAAQLHARLVALAVSGPPPSVSPASARATAASILNGGRFGKATIPDPLLTALRKLGDWLGSLASRTPGGPVVFWAWAAVLVLAGAAAGAHRMLRRLDSAHAMSVAAVGAAAEDPDALEREAQSAEARGAFGDAVRLRFRAGLLRLGAGAAIDYRPSLRTAEVAGRLHSPQFDALASTFERVAYGGARAEPADADAAREGWKALLARLGGGR